MPAASDDLHEANHSGHQLPDALRSAFEWLPIGIAITSTDGTILFVNRTLEQMLAYSAAELIGQPIEILVPEGKRAAHIQVRHEFVRRPQWVAMAAGRELFARRKDGSEVAVEIGLAPLPFGNRSLVLASIVDITERHRAQTLVRRARDERVLFEGLVGELAAQLINLPLDQVDRTIEEAIGRLGQALDLDCGALFQVVEESGEFIQTHFWTRPGWAAPPPRISASEQFPWHLAQLRAGELVTFTAVDDVPDAIDREGLRRLHIRSGATLPLIIRDRLWGAIFFATVGAPHTWPPEIIGRLRVVALIFANVLTRRQSDQDVRSATLQNALLRDRLSDENAYLRTELNTVVGAPAIVGHSPAIRRVFEQVRQVAASDAAVLLQGEIGTGKSVLANRIHELSARRARPLVRVHCDAVSSVQSDLFGRSKGTFVGDNARHIGLLELASGSTIFFDEVADLTAETQANVARLLQHQEVEDVGSGRPIAVDLRVIAATHHDLADRVRQGLFRDELYGCLNVFPIQVPPLRERLEDIPLLVWRFVDEFSRTYDRTIETIDQHSMDELQRYRWPGNACELRSVVERAVLLATGPRLRIPAPPAVDATRRLKLRKLGVRRSSRS